MSRAVVRKDDGLPDTYGPAMSALSNDRDRSFVMFFVIHGSAAQASRLAGFGRPESTPETHAKIGYRKLQDDRVRAAVMEEVRKWFHAAAPAAVREIHRILNDPKSKDSDKLRASDSVLARTDPVTTSQVIQVSHEHTHRHRLSADEVTARILELAARTGVDVKSLPPTIDAVAAEMPA